MVFETGFSLTCSSGNQKLLTVEASKRVSTATPGEEGEAVRVVACLE